MSKLILCLCNHERRIEAPSGAHTQQSLVQLLRFCQIWTKTDISLRIPTEGPIVLFLGRTFDKIISAIEEKQTFKMNKKAEEKMNEDD